MLRAAIVLSNTSWKMEPSTASAEAKPKATAPGISFACPGCAQNLKARAELAGRRVKCPRCGHAALAPRELPTAVDAKAAGLPNEPAAPARRLPIFWALLVAAMVCAGSIYA